MFVACLALPLAVAALGLWQYGRAGADLATLAAQRADIAAAVAALEGPRSAGAGIDLGRRFQRGGKTYVGDLALSQAHGALDDTDLSIAAAGCRRMLAPVVVVSGAIVAGLGLIVVGAAFGLGRAGRRSRDALIAGFTTVRRVLPGLLVLLIVVSAAGVVCAVVVTALALVDPADPSPRRLALLGAGLLAIGAALVTTVRAVLQLGRVAGIFTPDPLVVAGCAVSAGDAPGLWQVATMLAGRLGAPPPDDIVVGLTGDFFVVAGPVRLEGDDRTLPGNTLYVPLPYLALHDRDEVAVIIGHELAHFAGGDTAYSLRFAPIHAGVVRSLDALVEAGTTRQGGLALLVQPALRLGIYAMDQFHHAMQGWSRRREFAADAASAALVSPVIAARTMLRHEALRGLVDDVLGFAWDHPGQMPADLVAVMLDQAPVRGLDDPTARLADHVPHPTDSHPPTRERLAAFGQDLSDAMIAAATALPGPGALARLGAWFVDPDTVARQATAQFLADATEAARTWRADLTAQAAAVGDDAVALHENTAPIAAIVFTLAALHLGGGLALAVLGVPGIDRDMTALIALGLIAAGLAYVVMALLALRRGRRPFLVLRRDALLHRHLDRPIAWSEIATLEVYERGGSVITGLLLHGDAPLPGRTGGGRRVRIDRGRRLVTFAAVPPRHLKVRGFADLIYRYHDADQAQRALARADAGEA